jgi:hypothetical protein
VDRTRDSQVRYGRRASPRFNGEREYGTSLWYVVEEEEANGEGRPDIDIESRAIARI